MSQLLPHNSFLGLIDPNASPRASRLKRPSPIPMQLTERDEAIITRCWEDKLMSTSDLHALFFGAKARCVARLRTLYSNHYLDRYLFPVQTPYRGATEALYTIGTKGSHVVSLRLDQSLNYVAMKRREFNARTHDPSFLLTFRHLRAVIATRLRFEQAFNRSDTWQMLGWIPERLLEDQFVVNTDGTVKRVKLRPDGFFQYQHTPSGHTYSAFVEADLGTMSHAQVVAKANRYLHYFQTDLPQRRFGTRWFRVLLITTSDQRATHLWQTLSRLTHSLFWITSFEAIHQQQWLDAPIWLKVGHDGRHSLVNERQGLGDRG